MVKFLLLACLCLSASASAVAESRVQVRKEGESFFFEVCGPEAKCEPLGRSSGYSRAELDHWSKNFQVSKSSWRENLPLFLGGTGAIATISAMAFGLPLAIPLGIGLVTMAIFGVGFSQHPQIKAKMPNQVYSEFQANPEMIKKLQNYLVQLDAGLPGLVGPQVISGAYVPKSSAVVTEESTLAPAAKIAN